MEDKLPESIETALETDAETFQAEPVYYHRPRRHRSGSRHWVVSPLWVAIVLQSLVIAGLLIWGAWLQQEAESYIASENKLTKMLADVQEEKQKLKAEFDAYKKQYGNTFISRLIPLKFDEVMILDKDYVKSAMFMLSGKKDKPVMEYKIVLKNTKLNSVTPQFDLVFFDTLGAQIGSSPIDRDNKSGQPLEKGEVRSYDGVFELANGTAPGFIMVKFKDADNNGGMKSGE